MAIIARVNIRIIDVNKEQGLHAYKFYENKSKLEDISMNINDDLSMHGETISVLRHTGHYEAIYHNSNFGANFQ